MKEVVYNSLTPEEFEGRWISLIQSFKLEGNEWLNGLWEDRRRWVPAYVKDYTKALDHYANPEKVATANDRRETHLSEHVTEYTTKDRIQFGDPVHHVPKELKPKGDKIAKESKYGVLQYEYEKVFQLAMSSPEL
ncbi:Protein FAR1-RELATED SEQUENCE 1 [Bienertia sinuspersici]